MPTRKPKRTNWKQRAIRAEEQAERHWQVIKHQNREMQANPFQWGTAKQYVIGPEGEEYWPRDEMNRLINDAWQAKAEETKTLKATLAKLESAERHNAELLKEREELAKYNKASELEREHWLKECQTLKCRASAQHVRPSWLRRNWVELTVMATVLGAIAFIVWRAWHG